MKLRAPCVPLVTVDPYFSIWSSTDRLTESHTCHWTGKPQRLEGTLFVDGEPRAFLGKPEGAEPLPQTGVEITACATEYRFSDGAVALTAKFTTPLLLDDLAVASRPVSYVEVTASVLDGKDHELALRLLVDDAVCLDTKYQRPTVFQEVEIPGLTACRVGAALQRILNRSGDDLRIDWGYAYLATDAPGARVQDLPSANEYGTPAHEMQITVPGGHALFALAYDDIRSIRYFGEDLPSYWNRNGKTIETAISEAFGEYEALSARCAALDADLRRRARNEKYYELLALAYRQVIAAHKIAVDPEGKLLFISKECFSNGCAATADVTYPSIPLFLLYNPELVNGMLRPVFRYARSEEWFYPFAPHDAGQYPLVNGQVYSGGTRPEGQMPVEECGNMLIAAAAAALASGDLSLAEEYWPELETWAEYLMKYGLDPANQLCTDDFAGHLAHNCNLGLKAILGIASFGLLHGLRGNGEEKDRLLQKAREMAAQWMEKAADSESIYRLAFDQPGSYSMKYNAVWDTIFETEIFPKDAFAAEISLHIAKHTNRYGLVLDNRADYTKSDWILWTAAMAPEEEQFNALMEPVWLAYHESESRVPMNDWFDTKTAKQVYFQNRTVQGGLFMRVLKESGVCRAK